MANLEDTIRDLATRGELNHISLTPSRNGKMWRASFAMCSGFGISFAEDEDPVKAIVVACTTAKMKPQRTAKRSQIVDVKADRVEDHSADDLM